MSIINDIKQKLDIVELLGEYVKLQKSGRNFRALCPFHSEKTPSFFVFPEQQSWHCFGACGTGGDIYSFIMKKEGVDFGQALRILAEKTGVALVIPDLQDKEKDNKREKLIRLNEATAAYYHHLLANTPAGEKARNYLAQREISPKIMEDFQLGFSPDSFEETSRYLLSEGYAETDLLDAGLALERDGGGSYDRFRNRLMFPIRDIKGHVIGFGARALDDSLPKYLNSPQTLIFDKSSSLYAIDRAKESIRQKNVAVVMEGYMDVLSAHQNDWDNTVASMGTALTEKQLASLKRLTKNLLLALDADIAGEEATLRMAETINIEDYLHAEVKVVVPSHGKDPDEEIRKNPALWAQSLEKAVPIIDYVFNTVKNNFDLKSAQGKDLVAERLLHIISKIDNPVQRGHYVQEVARIVKIKPNDLRDRVIKIRIDEGKRIKKVDRPTPQKSVLSSFNPAEEYCLGLLLQYPGLRTEGMKLNKDYFESSETREIFLKWQQSTDINSLNDNLDSNLHHYLEHLLNKAYPPTLKEDEDKQKRVLDDCVIQLHEKLLKNLEFKKAELLAMEAELGGEEAELARLKELGIEESKQLKEVFAEQSRRRHSAV